jgi:hypothetical protein
MKPLFHFVFVGFFLVTLAAANDRFDCYQGFDSFPSQPKETKLSKPVFIISLPTNPYREPDKFMVLNEAGSEEVTATRIPQDEKVFALPSTVVNALAVKPRGETGFVEAEFSTELDQLRKDQPNYFEPASKEPCKGFKDERSIHMEVCQHPTTAVTKILDMDVKADLKNAIVRKSLGNARQWLDKTATLTELKAALKSDLPRIQKAYQDSFDKLTKCSSAFPGDGDILGAVDNQKNVLTEIIGKIGDLMAAPQTSSQPPGPTGNSNSAIH